MVKRFLFLGFLLFSFFSCSQDDNEINKVEVASVAEKKEIHLENFAEILSRVVYEDRGVREFLKKEACKKFDKDYDVLFYLVKDKVIGDKTFKEILIEYSSKEKIETIEKNVPLLNILVPEIAFFNISAENLNVEDEEIPVVVAKKEITRLYYNGEIESDLEKGEVPDFHVFVVNENDRVEVPIIDTNSAVQSKSSSFASNSEPSVKFRSENFNGMREESLNYGAKYNNIYRGDEDLNPLVIEAAKIFSAEDGSVNSKAYQRDYIYYGITPEKSKGNLNRAITEGISGFRVNPGSYFKIADDKTSDNTDNNDPRIKNYTTSQKKRKLTQQELVDRMWTKGAYEFKFEIFTSNSDRPDVSQRSVTAAELWDFNIEHTSRRHGTFFRSSKNTYKIDPSKFTSKFVDLNGVNFAKWDISQESLHRVVYVSEVDIDTQFTVSETFTSSKVKENRFNGNVKLGIGTGLSKNDGDNLNFELGADVNRTNTTTVSRTITRTYSTGDDQLGKVDVFFYDPVVDKIEKTENARRYKLRTYDTGHVSFSVVPM